MKRNHSQNATSHQKSESACIDRESSLAKGAHSKTLNIAPLNLNTINSSNNNNYLEQGLEIINHKQQKSASSTQNFEKMYTKLFTAITDFYLEVKHATLQEVSRHLGIQN